MPYTVEYTHNKRRGLLSASASTQQNAEIGFKRTVGLMTGTAKQLHPETIKKFDSEPEAAVYAETFAKSLGRPVPSDATSADNASRVFPPPPAPPGEAGDDE